jgi:voltage-gated potassium channel
MHLRQNTGVNQDLPGGRLPSLRKLLRPQTSKPRIPHALASVIGTESHTPTEPEVSDLLFTGLTTAFLKEFAFDLWVTSPLWLTLATAVTVLGQLVGKREGWSRFDSFYWSFITATTVGYGDFRPTKTVPRIFAIVIALVGLMLTGILVAVAVHSATVALAGHDASIRVR